MCLCSGAEDIAAVSLATAAQCSAAAAALPSAVRRPGHVIGAQLPVAAQRGDEWSNAFENSQSNIWS
jgi:hypothetical protein